MNKCIRDVCMAYGWKKNACPHKAVDPLELAIDHDSESDKQYNLD